MSSTPQPLPRSRDWPSRDLALWPSAVGFLQFVSDTAVNKLTGLDEAQARATPIPTSPVMSLLGLVKHLTAVQRQHVQRHIGGSDRPSLWRSDDHDFEFRIGADETIASVIAALDEELALSITTLQSIDPEQMVTAHDRPVRAGRLFVDVVQESARHLGHMDIIRELIDGDTGE